MAERTYIVKERADFTMSYEVNASSKREALQKVRDMDPGVFRIGEDGPQNLRLLLSDVEILHRAATPVENREEQGR